MNNRVEITGECTFVGPVEEVGQNKFKKRTFVLSEKADGAMYPTAIAFTLTKERTSLVTERMKGGTLTVTGYVESRGWVDPRTEKTRYFTEVNAVSVKPAEGRQAAPEAAVEAGDEGDMDDMPF